MNGCDACDGKNPLAFPNTSKPKKTHVLTGFCLRENKLGICLDGSPAGDDAKTGAPCLKKKKKEKKEGGDQSDKGIKRRL